MKKILMILMMMCSSAFAKDTVKFILPQPPGGLNDVFLRVIQKQINENEELNMNVIVINKPGGDGYIAVNDALTDKSDYVFLFSGPGFLYKATETEENFKRASSIVPVIHCMTTPTVFLVEKNSKIKTWKELVEYSKTNPVNIGTNSFIASYIIKDVLPNGNVTIVPFPGDAPVVLNLRNKSLDVGMTTYFTSIPHSASGELITLMSTHENEEGLLHVNSNHGNIVLGFFAPPSMNDQKINKMNKIISNILKTKEVKELFANRGVYLAKDTSRETFTKKVNSIIKDVKK